MKNLFKYVILTLLAFSAFAALSSTTVIYNEKKTNISVTKEQPEFTIQLKSNPTTGFSWFLREYDSELVKPLEHHFVKGNSRLIGSPGMEEWTFRISPQAFAVPHQTVIRFVYARPWEKVPQSTGVAFIVSTQTKE